MCWRTDRSVWAVGGSGVMYESSDGGQTFTFNKDAQGIPGNLYRVKFFDALKGYVLGSDGVLLKYCGS